MIRSQQLRCPHGLAARSTLSLACALLLAAGGCADPELDTLYGRQRLPLGWASVNGTDVLAEMFAEARHEVTSRRTLITSDMQSVDAIVWFPDDFHAPDEGICRWLDRWLAARAGRTLICVGRDFDAAPLYWRTMAPKVAPQQQPAYRARAAEAAAHAYHSYKDDDEQLECDWFKIKSDDKREAEKLGGPWSKDIQSSKTQIELGAKLASTAVRRRLLTAADDVLVARRQLSGGNQSQLILIANGSFLLNL
ncbi:MAG TPA: hypothetical protein VGX76_16185, partial [Pirellulales bacterium]|nr:hypothetical protein [Pirellulales bacterium]